MFRQSLRLFYVQRVDLVSAGSDMGWCSALAKFVEYITLESRSNDLKAF